ncbi:hypothetical protein DYB26_006091, partial [Aphanomyces astaci]
MVAAITQAVEQHTFDQFTGRCRLPVAFMQDHGLFNGSAVAVYVNGDCYLCKAHASRQRNAFAIDTSIAIEATHVVLAALPKIRLEHTHEDDVFVSVLPSPLKSAASISLEPVPSDKSSNDDTNTVLQDPISLRILQDACRRLILHESCVIQLPHPTNNTSMTFRVHRTLPIGVVRVIRATRVVLFRTSEAEPRDDNNVILPLDVQLRKPAFDKSHQDEDAATTHVGGLHVELKKLEELIYMAVEFPSLQQDIGIQLPKGVLLSGPPGVGKTLLVRTAIRRCHASGACHLMLRVINGAEILSGGGIGDAERALRDLFDQGRAFTRQSNRHVFCLFLDELDALCPRREASGRSHSRIVAQLLTLMDGVNFSKMMGYVYVVDVDPIYDGSAGKILSVAILAQSAGHMKIAHITEVYSIAAISTDKVTFLVAIEPEVKVLHRWFKP